MAQLNWTYLSDTGRQHVVGLFHGDRTGHLLVHCNSRIVLIDFHVLHSKNYSFFIDDELCEIRVKRKNGSFSYGFDINKEVDTPKNRKRKATEKKHLKKGMLFLAALVLFVLLVFFGLRHRNSSKFPGNLDRNAAETWAKVSLENGNATPARIDYSFVAGGRVIKGSTGLPPVTAASEMPIETGDEFLVRYAPNHPGVHQVDFNRPSPRQVDRYRQRARDKHRMLHPDLSPERIDCVLDVLFEAYGMTALASVFFQDYAAGRNPAHNQQTYRQLIEDPQVASQLTLRCSTK